MNEGMWSIGRMMLTRENQSIRRNPVSVPHTHYESYMDWPGIEPRPPQ